MSEAPAIPAATVIVMREGAGAPELLMVERAQGMAFAGGALVFPGGRVDAGDVALAARLGLADAEEGAARIAAIRETIEEAGVALGLGAIGAPELERLRAALHAGEALGHAWQGTLDLDVLVPFARWVPRALASRRFDTRFYLARLPEGAGEARADAGESVRLFWAPARAVLGDADAGRVSLIFPTRRNLERLAQFDSFEEAVADARAHPVDPITPTVESHDGVEFLCIPAHRGYPVTAEPLAGLRRG